LLHSANNDSASAAISKVAVAHFWVNTRYYVASKLHGPVTRASMRGVQLLLYRRKTMGLRSGACRETKWSKQARKLKAFSTRGVF